MGVGKALSYPQVLSKPPVQRRDIDTQRRKRTSHPVVGAVSGSVGEQDGWIAGASGSLLSGRGTLVVLTRGGRWVEDNSFGTLNVGAAWRALAAACQGHAAQRLAADLGLEGGAKEDLTDVERALAGGTHRRR